MASIKYILCSALFWVNLESVSGSGMATSLFGGFGTESSDLDKLFAKFDQDNSGW